MFTINDGNRKRLCEYPFNKKGEKARRSPNFQREQLQFFFQKEHLVIYFETLEDENRILQFVDCARSIILRGKLLPISFFVYERKEQKGGAVGELWLNYPDVIELESDLSRIELELEQLIKGGASFTSSQRYWGKFVYVIEYLQKLAERFPQLYDYDIFSMKEQLFSMVTQRFLRERDSRYLGLFVRYFYDFFNAIEGENQEEVKVKVCVLQHYGELHTQQVLGVFIALRADDAGSMVRKDTIINGLQQRIRKVSVVEESYSELRSSKGRVCYCELRRGKLGTFSSREVRNLQCGLASAVKSWKRESIYAFCVPRNQEELLKQLHMLSKEVQVKEDIPQLMVCFDHYSDQKTTFLVLIVAPLLDSAKALEIEDGDITIEMAKDIVGYDDFKKRSWVIKVTLPNTLIKKEREFYRARKRVLEKIGVYFQEYRDYNGGIIEKQEKAYDEFVLICKKEGIYKEMLCEQFFYGIQPDYMRSLFTVSSLVCWYKAFVSFLYKNPRKGIKKEQGALFFLSKRKIPKKGWDKWLLNLGLSSSNWGYFSVDFFGESVHGLLFLSVSDATFERITALFYEKSASLNL